MLRAGASTSRRSDVAIPVDITPLELRDLADDDVNQGAGVVRGMRFKATRLLTRFVVVSFAELVSPASRRKSTILSAARAGSGSSATGSDRGSTKVVPSNRSLHEGRGGVEQTWRLAGVADAVQVCIALVGVARVRAVVEIVRHAVIVAIAKSQGYKAPDPEHVAAGLGRS